MVDNHRKPKKGNLANQFRAPKKGEGLDWDAIMRCHRPEGVSEPLPPKLQLTLTELDRANRGVQNRYDGKDEEREHGYRKKNPGRRMGQGRHPSFDVDEAVRLYTEEHLTPQEVADRLGIKTAVTIIRKLKERDVYDPNKYRYGSPHSKHKVKPVQRTPESYKRKDRCKNGHDLTLPGATSKRWKTKPDGTKVSNGRECLACLRDKNNRLRGKGNG